jgi:DNA-binding Xre family transcriptional regulator
MPMLRLRVNELLAKRGLTAYALSKASDGRISMTTAYRLRDTDGELDTFNSEMLEALCDVLGVEIKELIERVPEKRGKGR